MGNRTRLRIITPEKTFFDDMVDMVIVRTTTGDIGVMANHISMTTTLSSGIATISDGDKEYKAAVHGGFAEVLRANVTIVTDAAEWAHNIDKKRAEDARERAQRRMDSPEGNDVRRAEIALHKALVRIEASSYKVDEYGQNIKMPQV